MDFTLNGRRAYAYTGGRALDPSLPAIVFIHGALHDHSVWTLAARWFAHHGHAVLAVDQPAHGRSEGPPLASIGEIADWALALVRSAGVGSVAWVGHSMGSLIALEAAARAPGLASRLVMVGTAYPMAVSPALLSTALNEPLKAIEMVNSFSLSTWAAKPSYPGPGAWLHGGNRALMRRVLAGCGSTNLFHHDFVLCDGYRGAEEAAAAVRCTAHLIVGERDQMTPPKAAQSLADALKARVHRLPAGHGLMQEDPEGLLQALRTAIQG